MNEKVNNLRSEYTDPTSFLYMPRYSMLAPAVMDYATWDLKKKTLRKQKTARKYAGIGSVDTYNFDEFIAGVIVNGIRAFEIYQHPLVNLEAWNKFKEENPKSFGDSFEDALTLVATNLSKYRQDNDSFFAYHGEDVLKQTLETFLALFPHLKHASTRTNPRTSPILYEDYLNAKNDIVSKQALKRHHMERKIYAVSQYDVTELDDYFASIFGIGFKILAKQTHGYPGDLNPEQWAKTLRNIASGFKAYHLDKTPLAESVKNDFISRFTSFWD